MTDVVEEIAENKRDKVSHDVENVPIEQKLRGGFVCPTCHVSRLTCYFQMGSSLKFAPLPQESFLHTRHVWQVWWFHELPQRKGSP